MLIKQNKRNIYPLINNNNTIYNYCIIIYKPSTPKTFNSTRVNKNHLQNVARSCANSRLKCVYYTSVIARGRKSCKMCIFSQFLNFTTFCIILQLFATSCQFSATFFFQLKCIFLQFDLNLQTSYCQPTH